MKDTPVCNAGAAVLPRSREILLASTKRAVRPWIAASWEFGYATMAISVRASSVAFVSFASTNVSFANPYHRR